MRISILISLAIFLSFEANGEEVRNDVCEAYALRDSVAAVFPINGKRNIWKWYISKKITDHAEYAWIAEPGKIFNQGSREFIGNGVAFSISLRNSESIKRTEKSGSLQEIINLSKKNAYLTKISIQDKDELDNIFLMHSSIIQGKLTDENSLLIATMDRMTTSLVKKGHPTHMKMTAFMPYPEESYECIVEIHYEDGG
ncbi:hypothetical protein [Delftia tsuruhatensis]|uniref:hypothetical protein n=1 Tax=Delftia tsuruhatensis TaxID=180282 RepID=UPI001F43BC33|nr:hypothetical protein [Delftia tsuruhatensis]